MASTYKGYESVLIDLRIMAAVCCTDRMVEAAKIAGVTYRCFKKRALRLGIYKPNHREGVPRSVITVDDILSGNAPRMTSSKVRNRLIAEGILENKCSVCGISEWLGSSIVCQLHHINGNSSDHKRENLSMLCPNCHSQTETFSGKNKGSVGQRGVSR